MSVVARGTIGTCANSFTSSSLGSDAIGSLPVHGFRVLLRAASGLCFRAFDLDGIQLLFWQLFAITRNNQRKRERCMRVVACANAVCVCVRVTPHPPLFPAIQTYGHTLRTKTQTYTP